MRLEWWTILLPPLTDSNIGHKNLYTFLELYVAARCEPSGNHSLLPKPDRLPGHIAQDQTGCRDGMPWGRPRYTPAKGFRNLLRSGSKDVSPSHRVCGYRRALERLIKSNAVWTNEAENKTIISAIFMADILLSKALAIILKAAQRYLSRYPLK